MARLIACPDCGSRFDVATMRVGTRFRCGACGKILIVPPPASAKSAPAKPAPKAAPGKPAAIRRRRVARGGVRKPAAPLKQPAPPKPAPPKPAAQSKPVTRPSAPVKPAPTPAPPPEPIAPAYAEATAGRSAVEDLARPHRDPLLGKTIKNTFRIDSKLGQGGYGVVYKAIDLALQRPVALKVMLRRLTDSAEFVGKFRREARTAAALAHPNIVSIHDVGFDRDLGVHYLAMEYVDGKTLTDIMETRGALAPQEAIDLILQAANGLAAAHAKQIVHRDIKPGNMMITDRGVVKITDFGLAKVTDPDGATSTIIGSPNYMPPEQFEGKVQDGRSDIYSLGISFYLMLTGVRPFDGNSPAVILRNIMTKEPEPVEELAPGLPRGLSPIVRRMIERNLDERYSDVGDVARDLRRLYSRETGGVRVFCATCGTPNALGVKRCSECTSSLMEPCPKCGTEDFIGVKFCGNCGCSIAQEKEFAEILAEGRDLRTSGRPDRALDKFKRLVELRPDDEEAGVALDFVEKEALALEKHRASVQKAMETGDLDRAGELLEQARERFAGDPDLRAAEETLADQLRRRRIDACLASAREGLDHRHYEDALAAAEEAAAAGAPAEETDPLREEALAALDRLAEIAARARDLEAGGSIAAAVAEWEKARAISPAWAPAVEALEAHRESLEKTEHAREIATQAFEKGDLAAARASALEVVDIIADDPGAAELLERVAKAEGDIRRRLVSTMRQLTSGDTRGAFSEVEDLLDRFPSYPDLGAVREHLETLLGAADFFRKLSSRSEEHGRLEQAVAYAGVADWLNSADSRARESAARTERELEERRETLVRAREHVEAGDFEGAVEMIRPLADSLPDDSEVQALCADARRGLEDHRREEQRRLVSELNEALREAREALRKGDLETARGAAGKARQLAPESAEVRALLKEIEETTERERKVEETAFFRLEDLRKMAKEGR